VVNDVLKLAYVTVFSEVTCGVVTILEIFV